MKKICLLFVMLTALSGCVAPGEKSSIVTFCQERIFCQVFFADILSGFLTSFIFLFFLLFFLRPRIRVSSQIATHVKAYDSSLPPQRWFCFKMINRSFFRAFDVRVEVVEKIPVTGPGGKTNYRSVPVKLVKSEYNYVASFTYTDRSDYALWFMTTDDIKTLLDTNQHHKIELRIICKHGLTGLGSVFVKTYSKHDIHDGTFKSGNTFDIVN
jgi:hypothetical protein